MTRVAIVTGGTRGLGAAVSKSLKAQGCKIAAVYHGNTKTVESRPTLWVMQQQTCWLMPW